MLKAINKMPDDWWYTRNDFYTVTSNEINAKESIETESYKALQKIKEIIQDSSLDDKECFMKIEEIVCIFEALGGSVGNRHDFG